MHLSSSQAYGENLIMIIATRLLLRYKIRRTYEKIVRYTVKFGFIRIGKTGSTAIKAALENEMIFFKHYINLRKVFDQNLADQVSFFVRDPAERFVSGFNSRLRKGAPRYNTRWSAEEAKAFSLFKTPDEIALALESPDDSVREDAKLGLNAIQHCRLDYRHYLDSVDFLEANKHRIVFIGVQEELDTDYRRLCRVLGLQDPPAPPEDDVGAHRTPAGFATALSEQGRANVLRHYASDLPIYEWCLRRRAEIVQSLP